MAIVSIYVGTKENKKLIEKNIFAGGCTNFDIIWHFRNIEGVTAQTVAGQVHLICKQGKMAKNILNKLVINIPDYFGEKCNIYLKDSKEIFMEYKVYKNRNTHIKFNKEFMKAMNVEVSRLLGWIKSADDIKKEFPEELAKGAEKYFKANYTCVGTNGLLMLTARNEG